MSMEAEGDGDEVQERNTGLPTRWNSRFLMLQWLVELRVALAITHGRSKDYHSLD